MKFVLRVLCLPLVVICCIIKCIATLTIKCGCYILSTVLWFIGMCCVYTILKQRWDQTLILLVIGSGGFLLLISVTLIAALAQGIALSLQNI